MTYLWGFLVLSNLIMAVIHGLNGDDVKEIQATLWAFIGYYMIHRIEDGK